MKRYLLLFPALAATVGCQENFDQFLVREAREYTEKHCPAIVAPDTRLDSATYDPAARTYHYWYTLTGQLDRPEAIAHLQTQQTTLRKELAAQLRATPAMKQCIEARINFGYTYCSATSRRPVVRVLVTPRDYD